AVLVFFFFFSSRRRHTRSLRDWSSDVCSSDLYGAALLFVRWDEASRPAGHLETEYLAFGSTPDEALAPVLALTLEQVKARYSVRSEERRVGKECRCRWWQEDEKKKRE